MKPNDEVIYSIIVPNMTASGALDRAHRTLVQHGVPETLHTVSNNALTVPRLYTRWRGDEAEQHWQQAIKADLPTAIIDVQPWSYAPGYPKGDIGE